MPSRCAGCRFSVIKYKREYKGYVVGCDRKDKMDMIRPGGTACYEPKGDNR